MLLSGPVPAAQRLEQSHPSDLYLIEIALWIVGILAGRLVPHSRLRTAVCVAVGIVGLLMFLWPICFGLSSDAGVPVPFLGESLLLGAVLALCIPAQKKRHT